MASTVTGQCARTEVLFGVAPAFALLVQFALWAVLERVVTVSCGHTYRELDGRTADNERSIKARTNVVEEVDLVLLRKERGADAVHGRISPSLSAASILQ